MEHKYNNDFPYYRKLSNNKSFYKILDDKNFEEIQILGSKKNHFKHFAEQYPEMLRIQDMINLHGEHYLNIEKEEWELLLSVE